VSAPSKESIDVLVKYMDQCDTKTKATIISSLTPLTREEVKPVLSKCLMDKDRRVVANSILALAEYHDDEIQEGLQAFLHHSDNRVRANTVIVVWSKAETSSRKEQLTSMLSTMLLDKNNDDCASALFAISQIKSMHFVPQIKAFANRNQDRIHGVPSIRRQFVNACSNLPGDETFDLVLSLASNRHSRVQKELAKGLFKLIENGDSLSFAIDRAKIEPYLKRSVIMRALCENEVFIPKDKDTILEDIALKEASSIYSDWLSICVLDTKATIAAVSLLRVAIHETSIMEKVKNLIYIAALCDRTGQIRSIMPRLYHPNRHIRARALEVLDNIGNTKVNKYLLKLLDSDDAVKHGREATINYKHRAKNLIETVSEYLNGSSEWLRTCSLYAAHALFDSTEEARWEHLYHRGLADVVHTIESKAS
jgi:HEAT repeat protein